MIYSCWDKEHDRLKLVILSHFLSIYSPKNPKNQNFEKMKNLLEISSFYTCIPKISIIWCTVPEIRYETDIIFCHFEPLFALLLHWQPRKSKFCKNEKSPYGYYHFTHMYHKWWSYDIWFLRHGGEQVYFFVILGN